MNNPIPETENVLVPRQLAEDLASHVDACYAAVKPEVQSHHLGWVKHTLDKIREQMLTLPQPGPVSPAPLADIEATLKRLIKHTINGGQAAEPLLRDLKAIGAGIAQLTAVPPGEPDIRRPKGEMVAVDSATLGHLMVALENGKNSIHPGGDTGRTAFLLGQAHELVKLLASSVESIGGNSLFDQDVALMTMIAETAVLGSRTPFANGVRAAVERMRGSLAGEGLDVDTLDPTEALRALSQGAGFEQEALDRGAQSAVDNAVAGFEIKREIHPAGGTFGLGDPDGGLPGMSALSPRGYAEAPLTPKGEADRIAVENKQRREAKNKHIRTEGDALDILREQLDRTARDIQDRVARAYRQGRKDSIDELNAPRMSGDFARHGMSVRQVPNGAIDKMMANQAAADNVDRSSSLHRIAAVVEKFTADSKDEGWRETLQKDIAEIRNALRNSGWMKK